MGEHNGRESRFLTTNQAADFLKLSPRTLEKMRITGDGPPYHKHGSRVFYTMPEILHWSNTRTHNSTSDVPGAMSPAHDESGTPPQPDA